MLIFSEKIEKSSKFPDFEFWKSNFSMKKYVLVCIFPLLDMDVLDATRTFLALCDTPGARVQEYSAKIHGFWSYPSYCMNSLTCNSNSEEQAY